MTATTPGSEFGTENSLDNPAADLTYDSVQASPGAEESLIQSDQLTFEHKKSVGAIIRVAIIGAVVLLLFVGLTIFLMQRQGSTALLQTGSFNEIHLPLKGIAAPEALLNAQSLKVNGGLQVTGSIVLSPTAQPKSPVTGQLYYDKSSNQLAFFNGQQFINLGGGGTNATNVTNVFNGGGGTSTAVSSASVLLQTGSNTVQQTGNFSVSGQGAVGSLNTTSITSSGGTLYINPVTIDTTPLPSGVPTNLGLTTVGSQVTGTGWANTLSANKVTVGNTGGNLQSISAYFAAGSSSAHVQVAIYEDDGDVPSKPGALLATSTSTNLVPGGWVTISMPGVTLSPNTTYWVAMNTDDTTATRAFDGGSQNYCFISSNFGFMPDPFSPPGCFGGNFTYSIYATYLTSASTPGSSSQAQVSIAPTGATLFQNTTDSNAALQVQNAAGGTIFNVDTVNGRIAIGKANASYKLDIAGGDINLSTNRSIRFGGLPALSVTSGGAKTSVTNFQSGGEVSIQGDNFRVQDQSATHANLFIDNNGATLFQNRTDTAAGFGIKNAGNQTLFNVDTLGGNVLLTGAGTGNVSVATAAGAGTTGNITIQTGDSSTTASGDISIDAGAGIVDGQLVSNKTFEAGLENLTSWFGTTLALSSAQARTGTNSLAETGTGSFEGIIEDTNNPLTPVTAGHQYYFSAWARAQTTPRTINIAVHWIGSGTTNSLTPTIDNTTGWTEVSSVVAAPAGATAAYITITHSGANGEVHYFDDLTITDLSSASAISSIDIGKTNAKIVTIGNLNQIGATSIYGGSGINLNGGASSININGGVINLTGNAASTLSTSSGALTVTSAATATWGVGTASTGVGGNLTLRAGGGGSDDNNDGGDLFLQGGARNGTGIAGSVIVKPPTDAADAFQIQNSAGTAFLVADSTNKRISITGTGASFASLTLDNAHFKSIQTTAPTIGTPASCGVTPTAAVTAGSTDTAGSFSITTGTGGTAASCDVILTFAQPYGAAPKSIIVVGKNDAASAARQIYVSGASTTTLTTSFGVSAGGANSTTYNFSYWVVE
jgi:hypothetical protein